MCAFLLCHTNCSLVNNESLYIIPLEIIVLIWYNSICKINENKTNRMRGTDMIMSSLFYVCVENNFFNAGTNTQYENMFRLAEKYAKEYVASDGKTDVAERLIDVIWVCSYDETTGENLDRSVVENAIKAWFENKRKAYAKRQQEMSKQKALELLVAHKECTEKKCSCASCNDGCDGCELMYAQGTVGEHIEAVEVAIEVLKEQIG